MTKRDLKLRISDSFEYFNNIGWVLQKDICPADLLSWIDEYDRNQSQPWHSDPLAEPVEEMRIKKIEPLETTIQYCVSGLGQKYSNRGLGDKLNELIDVVNEMREERT